MTVSDQIAELEKELSKTKYNKRTQHHIGLVKAKIARLKEKREQRSKSGPKFEGYSVRKSGDATVILIGFPSVGKSTLLNALTGANSQVAAYEFTTLDVVPGLLEHREAKVQVLDVPGIVKGAASGRGRGKEVLSVMRNADLVLILVDALHSEHHRVVKKEIYDTHLRLNQSRPDVTIKKTAKGGIDIGFTRKQTWLTPDTVKDILKEFRIMNAQVVVRENLTPDRLIDAIENNKIYIPGITVLTKIDLIDAETLAKLREKIKPDLEISADQNVNIDKLKDLIIDKLNFMRVYTKEVGKKADLTEPLIMKTGATVLDVCNKLHKDFISKFRFVRIWGKSAKFPGQKLSLKHVLKDKDIIEVHLT
ncbi:GTP-binding protein [Candidatus Woesearchaeota archaeon]|nr:GTP-binding protein [Candidatus Woesearchaeota archaeon]MBW3021448.1 GTP-binding protein [Candidatus Woesearchaeota archaeon]